MFKRFALLSLSAAILTSCTSGLYVKKLDLQTGAYIEKTSQNVQVVISTIDSLNNPSDGHNRFAYFMTIVNNSSERVAIEKADVVLDIGNTGVSAFLWDYKEYLHQIGLLRRNTTLGGSVEEADSFKNMYSDKGFPFGSISSNSKAEGYIAFNFDYGAIPEEKLAQLKQQNDEGKDIASSTIMVKLTTNSGNIIQELPIRVIFK